MIPRLYYRMNDDMTECKQTDIQVAGTDTASEDVDTRCKRISKGVIKWISTWRHRIQVRTPLKCALLITPICISVSALVVAVIVCAQWKLTLPNPAPATAPAEEFSEERVIPLLKAGNCGVRTFGSCNNEITMPLLLQKYVLDRVLLLRTEACKESNDVPVLRRRGMVLLDYLKRTNRGIKTHLQEESKEKSNCPLSSAYGRANRDISQKKCGEFDGASELYINAPPGADMQAVVGIFSHIVLTSRSSVDHAHLAAPVGAATFDRVTLAGKAAPVDTCLCSLKSEEDLLLEYQQYHRYAGPAAVETGISFAILEALKESLPFRCKKPLEIEMCRRAAASAASVDVKPTQASNSGRDSAGNFVREVDCFKFPNVLDPADPLVVPGTITPKYQCFHTTQFILAPQEAARALLALALRGRQRHIGRQGIIRHRRPKVSNSPLLHRTHRRLDSYRLDAELSSIAEAVTAAAAASRKPVLQYLACFFLKFGIGFWNGGAGGFELGRRVMLYAGVSNFTLEISPLGYLAPLLNIEMPNIQSTTSEPWMSAEKSWKGSRSSTQHQVAVNRPSCNSFDCPGALLLAAHYDSAPSSPGISDDLSMCGVALELTRAAVHRHLRAVNASLRLKLQTFGSSGSTLDIKGEINSAKLSYQMREGGALLGDLVVNLNGSEETGLQGAHSFASQHPAARRISVAVNLEAAGTGGKGVVFQIPPGLASRILDIMAGTSSPNLGSIALDIWSSGLFPGQTDFRIWRDVLGVKGGLDYAWIEDGRFYHTSQDNLSRLKRGSLQHTGNTMLEVLQHLLRLAESIPRCGGREGSVAKLIGPRISSRATTILRRALQTRQQLYLAETRCMKATKSSNYRYSEGSVDQRRSEGVNGVPFFQDFLGLYLLVIPPHWWSPLCLTLVCALVFSQYGVTRVLRVRLSIPLVLLSLLTFLLSSLEAAAALCCCSLLAPLLFQLHCPLYVNWPTFALVRAAFASVILMRRWYKIFFSNVVNTRSLRLFSRFPASHHPQISLFSAHVGPLLFLTVVSCSLTLIGVASGIYIVLVLLGLLLPQVIILLLVAWFRGQQESRTYSAETSFRKTKGMHQLASSTASITRDITNDTTLAPLGISFLLLFMDASGAFLPIVLCMQAIISVLEGISGVSGRAAELFVEADMALCAGIMVPVLLIAVPMLAPPIFHCLHHASLSRKLANSSKGNGGKQWYPTKFWRHRWRLVAVVCASIAWLIFHASSNSPLGISTPRSIFYASKGIGSKDIQRGKLFGTSPKNKHSIPVQVTSQPDDTTPQERGFRDIVLRIPEYLNSIGISRVHLNSVLEGILQRPPPEFGGMLPRWLLRGLLDLQALPGPSFPFSKDHPLQLHLTLFRRSRVTVNALRDEPGANIFKLHHGRLTAEEIQSHMHFDGLFDHLAEEASSPIYDHYESFGQLQRRSVKGVGILGFGLPNLWNPGSRYLDQVVSSVRRAIVAAEKISQFSCDSQYFETPNAGMCCENYRGRLVPDVQFVQVFEPGNMQAPQRVAHLHPSGRKRGHWSVYTNASVRRTKAFYPPGELQRADSLYLSRLRGNVKISLRESGGVADVDLLISGSSITQLIVPSENVTSWNIERQVSVTVTKECDCYIISFTSTQPSPYVRLKFQQSGIHPVRFLTRTGVFDARAYNTNCDHTYLFRFLDYPVAYNRIDQKRSTALPACESVEESPFWNTLASGIPKFVEVSSSAADVVEWLLPAAPFESPLDFE